MRGLFLGLVLALSPACLRGGFEEIRELIRRGDFAAALPVCDRDLKTSPRDYRIWTLKGVALHSLGRERESLDAYQRALEISPKFLPALEGAAQVEYQTHDPHCEKTLEAILALRPDTPTAHAMLGVLAFERRDCAAAASHYEMARDAVRDPVSRWQLAMCYFRLERWDGAEAQFRELLKLRETDQIRYNLALSQWRGGRPGDAISTLEPILERAVPEADAMDLMASAYESNRQTDAAVATLRRAVDLYPRDERLYISLGALCLDHNAIPLGVEVLEAGARNVPRAARLRAMLGVLQARAGLAEKAESSFHEAERLAPEASFGAVGLAVTLMQLNAMDAARRVLREELTKRPGDVRILTTLAQALLQAASSSAELDEAQPLLERAAKLEPENARVQSLLGKAYMQREQVGKATPRLEAAIRLDPTDRTATYQLMIAYQRQGRAQEASRLEQRVRALVEAERNQETEAARFQLVKAPEGRPAQ